MAAAIPLALMGGGAALKSKATADQADKQRAQLNQSLARTSDTQKKGNALIEAQAATLAPGVRAATMANQVADNENRSTADLQAAGAADAQGNSIINTAGDNGAVSKEFLTSKADRALTEGNRLTSIAQELARTRAPGQLVEQEGQQRASLTDALASMWDTTKGLNAANAQAAQDTPLPSYAALGDVAQAAGAAYGGKAKGLGTSRMLPKNAKGGTIWSGGDTSMEGFA